MDLSPRDEFRSRSAKLRTKFPNDREWVDLNLAFILMDMAHEGQRTRDGKEYFYHPFHVAQSFLDHPVRMAIALLHDALESSQLKRSDLHKAGFSPRIINAIKALSRNKADGEVYFDFIERCSLNADALAVKIADISHNLDEARNDRLTDEKTLNNINKYIISKAYLIAVQEGRITAGSSMVDFMNSRPNFRDHSVTSSLIAKHSSRPAVSGIQPLVGEEIKAMAGDSVVNTYNFEATAQCSLNRDAIDAEISKIDRSLNFSQRDQLLDNPTISTINHNKISKAYLVAVKNGDIKAGSPVINFLSNRADYRKHGSIFPLVQSFLQRSLAAQPEKILRLAP